MNSKTFCPIPWIFQAARSNGDVRVCCQANVTKNKGVVRKENGKAFNAGKDDLSEARNAEMMKQMRLNMLTGVWSEECSRCKSEEDAGLNSRRQYEKEKNMLSYSSALEITNADGSINTEDVPIKYFDLRFGNFCNLKCRMCGPTDSNEWYSDWIKLKGNTFKETSGEVEIKQNKSGKLYTDEYNWPDKQIFWSYLEKHAENIEYIYFAGGEPMLIEKHYDFLKRARADIGISVNHPGVIPQEVIDLFPLGILNALGGDLPKYRGMPVKHGQSSMARNELVCAFIA